MSHPSLPESVLTTEAAASALSRSRVTLERWRRLRTGPPFFSIMGRVYYDRGELTAWLEAQKLATHRRHERPSDALISGPV